MLIFSVDILCFRKNKSVIPTLDIRGHLIERVSEYKYLGTIIDDQLKFDKYSKSIYSKLNQRLYFLRKLYSFRIDNTILDMFYKTTVQSVLSFNLVCVFGNIREVDKCKFSRVIKQAEKKNHWYASAECRGTLFYSIVQDGEEYSIGSFPPVTIRICYEQKGNPVDTEKNPYSTLWQLLCTLSHQNVKWEFAIFLVIVLVYGTFLDIVWLKRILTFYSFVVYNYI